MGEQHHEQLPLVYSSVTKSRLLQPFLKKKLVGLEMDCSGR